MKKFFDFINIFSRNSPAKNLTPKISYGGNFKNVVLESTIFVDKSLFIKEALENPSQVTLITMPRRWGKSVNLDMLKRFLQVPHDHLREKADNLDKKLFFGGKVDLGTRGMKSLSPLKIANTKIKFETGYEASTEDIQGKYPVISVDFKDCKADDINSVKKLVNKKIIDLYEEHGYLGISQKPYNDLLTVAEKYKEILEDLKEGDFKNSIKYLSSLLYKHYDTRSWILIDEYDSSANKAYREFKNMDDAQKVADLFRDIFEPALKGNDHLAKGVITGVQYIVQSGMLSGVNNLEKYNITNSKFAQYYGVNQQEMDVLLDHFDIKNSKREQIRQWYNGYKEHAPDGAGFIDKYNIWSVVRYLNNQDSGFQSYWEESGDTKFLRKLLIQNEIKNKMESLISGESIALSLKADFSLDDFKTLKQITNLGTNYKINNNSISVLFSYLFITGYLTKIGKNVFTLPNQEVRHEMEKRLIEYYNTIYKFDDQKIHALTDILQAIINTKHSDDDRSSFVKNKLEQEFAVKFNEIIQECDFVNKKSGKGQKGVFANEDAVHSILSYIAIQIKHGFIASEIYTQKIGSNDRGRADTVIKSANTGIIIEVKHKGNLDNALQQAKTYKKLIEDCPEKVYVGLNLTNDKDVSLAAEIDCLGQSSKIEWHNENVMD